MNSKNYFMRGYLSLPYFIWISFKKYIYFCSKLPYFFQLRIRFNGSDLSVFRQIWFDMQYRDPFGLGNVKVIIDVGANVGYSALYFAHVYKESRIFAIEPEKNNFYYLQENCQLESRISCHNFALFNSNGFVNLINEHDLSCAYRFDATVVSDTVVESRSFSSFMEAFGLEKIDILKIDIEGTEKIIFSDKASQIWLKNVHVIIIELHDRFIPGSAKVFFDSISFMNYELSLNGENIFIKNLDFEIGKKL